MCNTVKHLIMIGIIYDISLLILENLLVWLEDMEKENTKRYKAGFGRHIQKSNRTQRRNSHSRCQGESC